MTCPHCGLEFPPRLRTQRFCSAACRRLDDLERIKTRDKATRRARDFMARTDPLVARALALSKFPELRTPEEQAALDKWLAERMPKVARGVA